MNSHMEIKDIENREDLSRFVKELHLSLKNGDRWENRDLGTFLEAMSAWIIDMDGHFENLNEPLPDQPSWQTFAQILSAATIYE